MVTIPHSVLTHVLATLGLCSHTLPLHSCLYFLSPHNGRHCARHCRDRGTYKNNAYAQRMWVQPRMGHSRPSPNHGTRQLILETSSGESDVCLRISAKDQKFAKLVIRGNRKSSSGMVATGQGWIVDTPFDCVVRFICSELTKLVGLPQNETPSESPSLRQFWFWHWNSLLYSLHCAGKRRLIHGMKRNRINGRDNINLYSVKQISSALQLLEQEAKNGMLNYSCLGLSI